MRAIEPSSRAPVRCRRGPHGEQRDQLDRALRQHAQLAGAVQRLGVVRRIDHLPRHLADPPVAAHRGRAQQLERLVLGQPACAHQHALGAIDPLALRVAPRQLVQRLAQRALVREARARQLHQRTQPARRAVVDHVGMHARGDGALDARRVGIRREDDHRPRCRGLQCRGLGEQGRVGTRLDADDHVRCVADRLAHQLAALRRTKHVNAGRIELAGQAGRSIVRSAKDQGRCHRGQLRLGCDAARDASCRPWGCGLAWRLRFKPRVQRRT